MNRILDVDSVNYFYYLNMKAMCYFVPTNTTIFLIRLAYIFILGKGSCFLESLYRLAENNKGRQLDVSGVTLCWVVLGQL